MNAFKILISIMFGCVCGYVIVNIIAVIYNAIAVKSNKITLFQMLEFDESLSQRLLFIRYITLLMFIPAGLVYDTFYWKRKRRELDER